eukprot:COSAG01_NODE_1130_length_11575_cov_6.349773_5_plen_59_part_00
MNFPAAVTDFNRQIDLDAQCPLALIVQGGPVMAVVGGWDAVSSRLRANTLTTPKHMQP